MTGGRILVTPVIPETMGCRTPPSDEVVVVGLPGEPLDGGDGEARMALVSPETMG
jgi:hypothetical protein